MKTIRRGVFETNSSTTHCATFLWKYRTIKEVPMRAVSTFPKLDADKVLEIELDIYWGEFTKDDYPGLDFNSVDTIIKYLAAQAVFSSEKEMWGRKNVEIKNTFDENHSMLLKDLQDAYGVMGLEVPVDVRYYFLDVDGNKVFVTKDNLFHWFYAYGVNPYYENKTKWETYVHRNIAQDPTAVDWPYAKKWFGVCSNDLLSGSYKEATRYYINARDLWDLSYKGNCECVDDGSDDITTVDMLTRQIGLEFYHS